jgi:hypothetical protein
MRLERQGENVLQALLFRMSELWNFSGAGALLESKGLTTILIDSGEEPAVKVKEGRKINTHSSSH